MQRYVVFAAYGCWEAIAERRFSSFESLERATAALENWTKQVSEKAKAEVQLINRDPSLKWTSEEYYVGFLLRLQGSLPPADGSADHIEDIEPMIDALDEQGQSVRDSIVEVRGASLSENGNEKRPLTKDDVLTIFLA